jgi:actin-related protein
VPERKAKEKQTERKELRKKQTKPKKQTKQAQSEVNCKTEQKAPVTLQEETFKEERKDANQPNPSPFASQAVALIMKLIVWRSKTTSPSQIEGRDRTS